MPEKIQLPINEIPDNINQFMRTYHSTLVISVCSTDAINGYGIMTWPAVELKMHEKICSRCGYSDLFSSTAFLNESHCQRHTWGKRQWSTVFAWTPNGNSLSLEECFDDWMNINKNAEYDGYHMKSYGRFGYT